MRGAWIPLAALLAACAPAPPTSDAPLAEFMEQVHQSTGFTGAVVVERWGEPVFEGGWGLANRDAGLDFGPDTPSDAGSLAKTLVAAGMWSLQAEGRIDLADEVQDYLPGFPHASTTLGHLLDHSAGIPDLDDPTGLSNEEIVGALADSPAFEPGSRFSYCNECFDILALVIERVTGEPWGDVLETRYFRPLGMDSAFIRPALLEDWEGVRTRGYRVVESETQDYDAYDDEPFYGSSNVYMSARDLARWGGAFVRGRAAPPEVLGEALERPRFAFGGPSALNRLGWFQPSPDGPAYFDGHLRGFHGVVYWDANTGLVVAWVSNVHGGRPVEIQLTRELVRIAEGGPPVGAPDFAGRRPMIEVDPAAHRGVFDVPGIGTVSVRPLDGILEIRVDEGPPTPAYPSTGYYVPDLGVELGFTGLDGGRYQRIHWLSVFDSVSGTRVER